MRYAAGPPTCAEPEKHEWALRSVDFEDAGPISVFECLVCGWVDYRAGSR